MNPFVALMDSAARGLTRSDPTISLQDWASFFTFNGNTYPLGLQQTLVGNREEIDGSFSSFANAAYRSNGIVFACMLVRMLLFSEARFAFQQMKNGRPGDLFATPALGILEKPWKNGTTGDLLARAIQDADLAGNAFFAKRPGGIRRLHPAWTTIVLGSMTDPAATAADIDAEVIGYVYHPNGRFSGSEPEVLLADEVAHFAPIPDPLASFRGMSWLTPIIREIQGDTEATSHKLRYYENGATVNLVVSLDASIKKEAFDEWIKAFERGHKGAANAYKTLYLGAGATATAVGSNLQQQDFKIVQGAGESRIAAASGIHPTIVGLSEGLAGSSLNAGNFGAAARLTADKTLRPLWRNFAGSMETLVPARTGSRLWYDDRDIPFLKDDQKDAAGVVQVRSQSIRTLIDGGFEATSVVDAISAGDFSRLVHTGLFSVQLQAPGSTKMPAGEVPGESPVGPGSGPVVLPAGDPSTKPVTGGTAPKQVGAPATPKQIAAPKKASGEPGDSEVRCSGCHKLLAEMASAPYRITCPRCRAVTSAA